MVRNKEDRQSVGKRVESKSHKSYTYKESGQNFVNFPGEDWWMSFRYQPEEFVNPET
jgi:hypothetical protein